MSILEIHGEQYHADEIANTPTLSASVAHVLLDRSPKHAWTCHPKLNPEYARVAEERFDLGTAVHAMFLEGREAFAVIPHDDWRTKAAQEARDTARAHGLIPLLAKQAEQVIAINGAIIEQLAKRDDDPRLFAAGGKVEVPILWQQDGVWCRALVDHLNADRTLLTDLKTTRASANPEQWQCTLFSIGADIEAVMHTRAVAALDPGRIVPPEMRFVVVEVEPPYAMSVVALAPSAWEIANAKVDKALAIWKRCLETGVWPSYRPDVAFVEAPGWVQSAWLEREMREEMAA